MKDIDLVDDPEPPGSRTQLALPGFGETADSPTFSSTAATDVRSPCLELPVFPVRAVTEPNRQRLSPRSAAFRRRFFPLSTNAEWCDWRWQVRNRVRDLATVESMLTLSADERAALSHPDGAFPVAVTPYYMSLLDPDDATQPLRRTVIPVCGERCRSAGEEDDPLGEDGQSPVPGLVHRYPDRVLLLTTGFCSTYCRFCTRSRLVGHDTGLTFDRAQWDRAIRYIAETPAVRDVLLSGGDPLTLADDQLEYLLSHLRAVPHVEIIRLGTKVPAVLPQRVTPGLTRMLKRYHPLLMSLHFTHPDELTPEASLACSRLADAGIPLGSQTVLLAGVNDHVPTMTRLVQGLLRNRVRPYYLYQCDPIPGSGHFRTPVSKGLEIIRGLRGHTSGYAVPHYVIDAPGGGGKIPLLPEYVSGREGADLVLRNYQGRTFRYPDCAATPSDMGRN